MLPWSRPYLTYEIVWLAGRMPREGWEPTFGGQISTDSFPIDIEAIEDGDSVNADDRRISAEESAPDIDRNMRDVCPNGVFDANTSNDENSQQVASEDLIIADNKGTSSEEPNPKVEHIVQQTCQGGILKAEESDSQNSDHSEEAADTVGSFIGRIHHAIRTGRLFVPVTASMQDSSREAWGA